MGYVVARCGGAVSHPLGRPFEGHGGLGGGRDTESTRQLYDYYIYKGHQ
jgi:hypothetical protein